MKKEQIIRKLSEGLASTQIDKFEELTKDILWESEESFTKKANIIRESYFNKKSKTESVKKANESKKVKPTSKTVVVTEEIKDEKEDLFAFKLASFELDVVKNCKDKTQKAAIRKAQTPLEVVKAISEIK